MNIIHDQPHHYHHHHYHYHLINIESLHQTYWMHHNLSITWFDGSTMVWWHSVMIVYRPSTLLIVSWYNLWWYSDQVWLCRMDYQYCPLHHPLCLIDQVGPDCTRIWKCLTLIWYHYFLWSLCCLHIYLQWLHIIRHILIYLFHIFWFFLPLIPILITISPIPSIFHISIHS